MKDKGTDEEVTDEESQMKRSQMKNGRHVQRSQIKIGWKTVKNHDFKICKCKLNKKKNILRLGILESIKL
jgi:hypothetical protein